MTEFCQMLLTMTAAATVAALIVMALRLPLKKAPRWITCALWLVVFARSNHCSRPRPVSSEQMKISRSP